MLHVAHHAACDQQTCKSVNVGMSRQKIPIKPADRVVMTIGIVVAALRPANFISHEDHRHPQRKQRDREKVLHLPVSQALYVRVLRWPFCATVPAAVVVTSIAIVLTVV